MKQERVSKGANIKGGVLTVLARCQQPRFAKTRVHALQTMHAREQVWVLLDEGQRQTPTSETRDAFPFLFAPHGRTRADLGELQIQHALEKDPVRGPDLKKVVSTVPHDFSYGWGCEEVEDGAEAGEGIGCSEGENVEDEDVLGVGGANAHEGKDAT